MIHSVKPISCLAFSHSLSLSLWEHCCCCRPIATWTCINLKHSSLHKNNNTASSHTRSISRSNRYHRYLTQRLLNPPFNKMKQQPSPAASRKSSTRVVGVLSSSLPHSVGSSSTTPGSAQHRHKKSSPISFPKSHIHRTPSELQLADDMRRAEYEDVRMYARLVVGMQSQCVASGYVHPLTRKSLQDIVKTKEANDEELEMMHLHHDEEADSGWDVNYIQDQAKPCHLPSSSLQTQPGTRVISLSPENFIKTQSDTSIISTNAESGVDLEDDDGEGVFCLEL